MSQKCLFVPDSQFAEQVGARVLEKWLRDISCRVCAVECQQMAAGKEIRDVGGEEHVKSLLQSGQARQLSQSSIH